MIEIPSFHNYRASLIQMAQTHVAPWPCSINTGVLDELPNNSRIFRSYSWADVLVTK